MVSNVLDNNIVLTKNYKVSLPSADIGFVIILIVFPPRLTNDIDIVRHDINEKTTRFVSRMKFFSSMNFINFYYRRWSYETSKRILLILIILLFFLYAYNPTMESSPIDHQPISSPPPSLLPIGLFIVADDAVSDTFNQHLGSLSCYAHRHRYQFILIHPNQYPSCTKTSHSIYFQKHCLVLMYLLDHTQIQWLVVLDIDVLVLNITKKFESFLPDMPNESPIHLILHEKFNGEIAAGNYIIQNHQWSHQFLFGWLQFERQTSRIRFHNHDNGPLHLYLLGRMVGNVSQSAYIRCLEMYDKANELALYHAYVGCCKCALDGRWEFDHVRILRRGHAFVRDNLGYDMQKRIWSPTDFLIHGHRQNLDVYYSQEIDVKECLHPNWTLPIRQDAIMTDFNEVQEVIQKFDHEAANAYPQSVGLPEISDCWPLCLNTKSRRLAFIMKVCNRTLI